MNRWFRILYCSPLLALSTLLDPIQTKATHSLDDEAAESESCQQRETAQAQREELNRRIREIRQSFNGRCTLPRSPQVRAPACPPGSGFRPLGNYHQASGMFFHCGCADIKKQPQAPVHRFLADFYRTLRRNRPDLPITVVVDERCIENCLVPLANELQENTAPFNVVIVNRNWGTQAQLDLFAQDAYINGVQGTPSRDLLLSSMDSFGSFDVHRSGRQAIQACPDLRYGGDLYDLQLKGATQRTASRDNGGDARGGNLVAFPGGVVAVGSNAPANTVRYLRQQGNHPVSIPVEGLPAEHADELFGVIRLPASKARGKCDFAVTVADPRQGRELAQRSGVTLSSQWLRQNEEIDRNVSRARPLLLQALRERTGCVNIPEIRLPVFWGANGLVNRALWPNPINGQAIDHQYYFPTAPDPAFPQLTNAVDQAIRQALGAQGVEVFPVDTSQVSAMQGDLHCATKLLTTCQ